MDLCNSHTVEESRDLHFAMIATKVYGLKGGKKHGTKNSLLIKRRDKSDDT